MRLAETDEVELETSRRAAVARRDPAADGEFVYAVTTTGICCRPSCPAKRPKPENLRLFASVAAARAAGFRPCKRCRPEDTQAEPGQAAWPATVCRRIEAAVAAGEKPPAIEEMARDAGLTPTHFRRAFQRIVGVTPRAYAEAARGRLVAAELSTAKTVTAAIGRSGFESHGRFYEAAPALLGMTPTEFRAGAPAVPIRFAVGECSLGSILVAATSRGLCAILLGDDPAELIADLERRFPRAELLGGDADFERLTAAAIGLVERPAGRCELPLDIRGTAFRRRVWEALRGIPAGTTVDYAALAARLGLPRGARAVAGACAANPLAVAIPCHRVVRRDGNLAGYRWGLARKRELLRREAAEPH